MIDFNDHIITQSSSILKALECINNIKGAGHLHVLFIRDIDDKIIGALTDGDIRRALIRGVSINENATTIMHKGFKFVNNNTDVIKAFHEFRDQDIYLVPRLSENGALLELIDLKEILSILPVECLIMAGGQGKRLLPLTEKTPKPLLKVGGKPIIEYNIERLQKFGVKNIHISVKYLGNQIKEYFGNGSSRGLSIRYVDETLELGTAGAVSLLPTICHPVLLLMNSDLLTNVDFEKMYLDFEKENADMIVATVPYTVKVPYAIMNIEQQQVTSFKEKPTFTYYSNAGIYMIKKELLELVPKGEFYDATDLMNAVIEKGYKLVAHPIRNYWLDIGKIEDFERAQKDIQFVKF